ncbi:membrane associated rhomboid family serine protease [Dysgonomonas sp. PFB1-18]|uniref:rhomboid family intramembrane serine protease n=1 Tax=unclassified Dysgonomonas TaxID=2630389 RepID=UPI002474E800|nr:MULTISPECIES: rhomboid family intramembrane serine protease [unclassified Dysgonomonas]MDH6310708.1 membrane associated rhomboid family serine protease [Dysgonomonas sp. PF1-14]MDH6340559.1 membrane associated rhomboid family serine protease [Dysgonomonas sp. PF1-16]MDH6382185.1 membrane associated rhomboid family serine protease [Dysgonomonas sp. PFB1-18]MDH6399528.1 membrane associated rhomboid family serine protease [Dysgonomonas sp. PF1-23]
MNQNNTGFMGGIPPVTRNLLIINALIFFAQYLLGINKGQFSIIDWYCALFPINSEYFFPHQIITYMFLHGSIGHVFFNMFAVYMFGRTLEMVWGSKKFFIYYIITGIGAGAAQLIVTYLTGSPYPTVGASGAVFGILVAFGMLFPNVELMLIFPPIPIKAKWFVIGYGALELFLGFADRAGDNVAHFAHLGGLFVGLIILLYWRKKGFMTNGNIFK